MTGAETVARDQLDRIAETLRTLRFQLLGVKASLPASPMESMRLLEMDEMDSSTQIRAIIDCVLEDHLDPRHPRPPCGGVQPPVRRGRLRAR